MGEWVCLGPGAGHTVLLAELVQACCRCLLVVSVCGKDRFVSCVFTGERTGGEMFSLVA